MKNCLFAPTFFGRPTSREDCVLKRRKGVYFYYYCSDTNSEKTSSCMTSRPHDLRCWIGRKSFAGLTNKTRLVKVPRSIEVFRQGANGVCRYFISPPEPSLNMVAEHVSHEEKKNVFFFVLLVAISHFFAWLCLPATSILVVQVRVAIPYYSSPCMQNYCKRRMRDETLE